TGDEARRTYNLNIANWIPDLFMERVKTDGVWSLFDPKTCAHLINLFGEDYRNAYLALEADAKFVRQVNARDLYARMMKSLAETGNGWMTFKDACNAKSNQTLIPGRIAHSSNLCTEIVEISSEGETAVRTAIRFLDRVIDVNFYPTPQAAASNRKWRPIGLGLMGLQDIFFELELPFDSQEAAALSRRIQEEIYFHALDESCDRARIRGKHPSFEETRAAQGLLQFDLWGECSADTERWNALKERIREHGLRNSLLLAIAPTATIA